MAILLLAGIATIAQNYPSEWARYASDGYFHDIESAQHKQDALDLARSNLAKQIQVRVKEISKIDKQVVDGRSSISYNSSKGFATDVDMNLAQTLSSYDANIGKYYVIAYINKEEACNFYENEMKMLISNIGSHIAIADNYISAGFKTKAKEELQTTLALFGRKDEPLFWLNVFGLDEYKIQQYLNEVNGNEQTVKSKLAELEHGLRIFLDCKSPMFDGKNYPLTDKLKGELSELGCSFITSASDADYAVYINAYAEIVSKSPFTSYEGMQTFSYVTREHATVSLTKKATEEVIYTDEMSEKGVGTRDQNKAASTGYEQLYHKIATVLKEKIQ